MQFPLPAGMMLDAIRSGRIRIGRGSDQSGYRSFMVLKAKSTRWPEPGATPKTGSPIAAEALARIAQLYAIEKETHGRPAEERLSVRHERSAPLVADLGTYASRRSPARSLRAVRSS